MELFKLGTVFSFHVHVCDGSWHVFLPKLNLVSVLRDMHGGVGVGSENVIEISYSMVSGLPKMAFAVSVSHFLEKTLHLAPS
ncbi:hypothetical protein QQP08_013894 [Theobroma cacao]|uniref:Uncharacterized protein n=1 Tax=Theobroma cacao TaxID=3641 RepID=A0A061EPT3_THECC|nr:Uncharacterized protein TCM_021106 [Theobroma cacao]WRX21407.1 hypothetical protein QQP08_013894 [Theobroma cacao]